MARLILRLDHIRVYRWSGDTNPEIVPSLAELILDQHLGQRLDFVFHDLCGQEVIETLYNAQYSNVPTYMTGIDCHRADGLIEVPTELDPGAQRLLK